MMDVTRTTVMTLIKATDILYTKHVWIVGDDDSAVAEDEDGNLELFRNYDEAYKFYEEQGYQDFYQ